ncbi:hypothetical protein [Bradyrhizobium sp. CCBAU 53421]|uniref:hypothetical protein n=1 Tax=Bradyrhizobium sp. CCBAU 53421 TaxID=1325120 RepID=UPI00188B3C2D|nr:hypothetical protein [Bradyrhizobium sp. CCBAU 53421]QOZ34070.1 hypothetical protein XH92_22395 [Bradyrhizobium sp. CCBAU 53421]
MTYRSNDEFFAELKGLIDAWCERRLLSPLSRILGPFLSFNGMTDGWGEVSAALKSTRAHDRNELTSSEQAKVDDLIQAATAVIHRK